jgi:hypothetical protein
VSVSLESNGNLLPKGREKNIIGQRKITFAYSATSRTLIHCRVEYTASSALKKIRNIDKKAIGKTPKRIKSESKRNTTRANNKAFVSDVTKESP